ncbi:MAG: hypothetical protein IID34_18180 [Planctomycetes bacterium]|nr:hypothetical protein [Planctomycetota bacterium]
MNDWKCAITLATCCCIVLTIAPAASADFVGVTTVIKDDPDTEFLCTQGNGDFVPGPLTVCNFYAVFDDPADRMLTAETDLQVYNGESPDVFFQHPFNPAVISPPCFFVDFIAPDLICDTFITIGYKCGPDPAGTDATTPGSDFDPTEFSENGHVIGYWFNAQENNGQGDAGTWPDLKVLFLQTSVAQGLSVDGTIILIFWQDPATGDVIGETDIPAACAAACPDGEPCDDGDPCTEGDVCNNQVCEGAPVDCSELDDKCNYGVCNPDTGMCEEVPLPDGTPCDDGDACTENDTCIDGVCTGLPIGCDDINPCTDDDCDPDTGCTHTPNNNPCDDGDACTVGDRCDDGCVHGMPINCDDGNACTIDSCDPATGCFTDPVDCDDEDACTEDGCDSDTGCTHQDIECLEGQVCDPASGECVEDQDPCECVNGRVTLCHIPQGNRANARTITVGCAARDRHLAHGDACGPCEDGDG